MGGENAQHRFSPGLETQLIPAHAGKTVAVQSTAPPCAAHPRSRRENLARVRERWPPGGSSPLTRGKHGYSGRVVSADRLIPAHAGKTRCPPGRDRACPAHPRSRGENGSACSMISVRSGSSPLTRGKRAHAAHGRRRMGLIPAHAGKTRPCCSRTPPYGAHPRSRGENLGRVGRVLPVRGLIPAHAGKTSCTSPSPYEASAHPRSRGEN